MQINITQKHIDDSNKAILWYTEEQTCCPIALAIHEQLYEGTYKLVNRPYPLSGKSIQFGGERGVNRCKVAETIRLEGVFFRPPINIMHTKESRQFVVDFDNGKTVKPFSLELPDKIREELFITKQTKQ